MIRLSLASVSLDDQIWWPLSQASTSAAPRRRRRRRRRCGDDDDDDGGGGSGHLISWRCQVLVEINFHLI